MGEERIIHDKLHKYWLALVAFSIIVLSTSSIEYAKASSSESTETPELVQPQLANSNTSLASSVYNTKELVLGSDVQDLVILIPNEGHHGPGEDDESRFIAQSFVPETAVINKGTNVIWFNGDVGHEHDIVVTNDAAASTSPIYQTGEFAEFETRNHTFNEVGQFQYAVTVPYENDYFMSGNISVVDGNDGDIGGQQSTGESTTVGLLMVPSQDISQYTADLQSIGITLDSTHNFQDLRGGQSGTGDEQTLIVWRLPDNSQVPNVLTQLAAFSEGLPYS
jgi:plastocyanin